MWKPINIRKKEKQNKEMFEQVKLLLTEICKNGGKLYLEEDNIYMIPNEEWADEEDQVVMWLDEIENKRG
jgi:hypothetical protein